MTISRALLPDMETLSSCCRLTISGGFSSFAAFNLAFTSDNDDFLSDDDEDFSAELADGVAVVKRNRTIVHSGSYCQVCVCVLCV